MNQQMKIQHNQHAHGYLPQGAGHLQGDLLQCLGVKQDDAQHAPSDAEDNQQRQVRHVQGYPPQKTGDLQGYPLRCLGVK